MLFLALALVLSMLAGVAGVTLGWFRSPSEPELQKPDDGTATNTPISPVNTEEPTQQLTGDTHTADASPTGTLAPILTPAPTQIVAGPPSPTPSPDPRVEGQLGVMSLEQKIGQMLLMGVDGQGITTATCGLIQRLSPGGIIYRRNNAENPQQLARFSSDLQICSAEGVGIPLFIAIDHEGQYVTRFKYGVTVFPAAMAQGSTGDPALAYQVALAAGQELAYSGVNMVLGPVADVLSDYDNTVISLRSFGGDAQDVNQFVSQAVHGYLQAGVIPVLKHFPGHGGVAVDTHYNVVSDQSSRASLVAEYLPPFQFGIEAGAPAVMFGHVAYPSIDEAVQPASISPSIVELLREDLGFQGIAMTDSMGMGAISGSTRNIAAASVQAVLAGEDVLLVTSPGTAQAAYDGLLNAVRSGQITEERINESLRSILETKAGWGLLSGSPSAATIPDWKANADLSFDAGYRAVTLFRDQPGYVPLPPAPQNILIIGPTDGWGLYPTLGEALQQNGYSYQIVTYSSPWNGAVPEVGYLDTLPIQAANYDFTVVLTWDAHLNRFRYGDTWQTQLVNRLIEKDIPLVVVALKSPTDILEFPQVPSYIATFGTTGGQIQSLADVLVGRHTATGENPLPGLP